ncbi:hypothetical protein M2336_001213 [Sphingobium sp. B1D7B]|uniref:hypothetical protein n=1 Tax=Sphingobium sp. B1D7B TaxID=2940578 RepID=UPI0022257CBA|nr:hypothetical protein [Sphingobium sp. B1D7B]MCW2404584.1 hypothetical protein [Sphingobium sp. B1D7B]
MERAQQGIPRASEVAERSEAVDGTQDNRRRNVLLSAWTLLNDDAGVMGLHAADLGRKSAVIHLPANRGCAP